MTFLDLYNEVIRSVYPEKVARNVAPIVKDWVRDALIELQNKVVQLREGNVEIVRQDSSYYTCGLSVMRAPRGWIRQVSIRHADQPGCRATPAVVVPREEMLAMRDSCPCSSLPQPLNQSVIPPFNLRIPDPTIDRINAVSYRYVSMFDGFIWWYPWFNSNEEILIEWAGQKKSWIDTDLIPASFLDERGTIDREIEMLIELYVTANKDTLHACKPRDVAFQLYRDRLARYIIARNEQDRLSIDPPHTPVCRPYASPALATAVAKWPVPVISEQDVDRWGVPVISEEDYDFPVTPTAPAPIIFPDSTTFIESRAVTITTSALSPYEIRFTVDGSTPNQSSTLYPGLITITDSRTIKAIVVKTGYNNSPVSQKSYTLIVPDVSPVVFSPADSSFIGGTVVLMTTATPAPYEIRYTTNGTEPTEASTLYPGVLTITNTTIFKAIVVKPGYRTIASSTKSYSKIIPSVASVQFTPTEPNFIESAEVSLSTPTPGATIRYTTNGTNPTELSTIYTGPITVTATTTIKAKAFKSGYTDSPITVKTMVKLVPVIVTFDRQEFATVFWDTKTASIGSATRLTMVVEQTSCTFNVRYNGVSLFGPLSMGPDGTHDNTLTLNALLSGGATSIEIQGDGASYFRLGGDTSGYTIFKFYAY